MNALTSALRKDIPVDDLPRALQHVVVAIIIIGALCQWATGAETRVGGVVKVAACVPVGVAIIVHLSNLWA